MRSHEVFQNTEIKMRNLNKFCVFQDYYGEEKKYFNFENNKGILLTDQN